MPQREKDLKIELVLLFRLKVLHESEVLLSDLGNIDVEDSKAEQVAGLAKPAQFDQQGSLT